MPAVGQQRHGVEPPTGDNLHDHHGSGDPHDGPRVPFCCLIPFVKDVVVGPRRQVLGMHRWLPSKGTW
jgi:hypothetical protein